jgi:hypothetical protein
MTPAHGITLLLWTLTIASEAVLAYVLTFKPGRKTYPAFNIFINFCLSRSLLLYAINIGGNREAYFYVYYVGVLLECGIKACVMVEIVRELFYPISILPGRSLNEICATVAFTTLVCVISAVLFPSTYPHLLFAAARVADRTFTFMVCLLSWAIALHAYKLGIPWRKRLLGIALGLGFDATVTSVVLTLGTSVGKIASVNLGMLIVCSGFVAMNTWTYFFLLPEPELISPASYRRLERSNLKEY